MTEEEKLEKYIEFEPNLLIFDQSKKNAEIQHLQQEKSELEKEKDAENWNKMTEKIAKRSDDQDKVIKMLVTKLQDLENKYTESIIKDEEE